MKHSGLGRHYQLKGSLSFLGQLLGRLTALLLRMRLEVKMIVVQSTQTVLLQREQMESTIIYEMDCELLVDSDLERLGMSCCYWDSTIVSSSKDNPRGSVLWLTGCV